MRALPVLLAAATAALAGAASAQPAPVAGAAAPSPQARRVDWQAMRQAHEAREAADLAVVLRLRPDQQAGLNAWLQAERPGPHVWRGPMQPATSPANPPTTAQVLDRDAARMAEHDAMERTRLDATRRFYASLGPDQQAVFDALERLRHGHGGERGGWGRHGMEGGMKMGGRGHGGPMGAGGPPPPQPSGD